MKRILAAVSDIHAGSTVAVCPPVQVKLSDGGRYIPSAAQRWLHQQWVGFWRQVKKRKTEADWFGVLVNGDATDGDHHNTPQIISKDMGVQSWILKKLFEPVLDLSPDMLMIVRGTEAHVGPNAGFEETFARWLAHEMGQTVPREPDTEMYSWWHFIGDLGPLRLSASHHGRIGTLPWTKANATMGLATQIFYEHAKRKERWPDLAIRSHFHTYLDTHDAHPVRVIQTPAWQLHTAYAYRVVPEVLADIGGVIITVEDGKPPLIESILSVPSRPEPVKLS